VSIELVEKEGKKQKGGYEDRTEHKTRSAHNTDRPIGREESIHTRHRHVKTGKQRMNVREGDRGYFWYSTNVENSLLLLKTRHPACGAFSQCNHDSESKYDNDGAFILQPRREGG